MTAPLFPGLTISKRYTTLKDATSATDTGAHRFDDYLVGFCVGNRDVLDFNIAVTSGNNGAHGIGHGVWLLSGADWATPVPGIIQL